MGKINIPRAETIEQALQRRQKEASRAREAYQKLRQSISKSEAEQAREILSGPRCQTLSLEAVTRYQDDDKERPYLRLYNSLHGEEYNVSTETDQPTYGFAAQAIRYAELLEVNRELSKLRARAAACGFELSDSDCSDMTDKFCRSRYKRTHAGLQRFLFDLNAEEIWQQLIRRFGDNLRELNWHILRKEYSLVLYTGKNVTELNYHEDSFALIEKAIDQAKQEQQCKQPRQA